MKGEGKGLRKAEVGQQQENDLLWQNYLFSKLAKLTS